MISPGGSPVVHGAIGAEPNKLPRVSYWQLRNDTCRPPCRQDEFFTPKLLEAAESDSGELAVDGRRLCWHVAGEWEQLRALPQEGEDIGHRRNSGPWPHLVPPRRPQEGAHASGFAASASAARPQIQFGAALGTI